VRGRRERISVGIASEDTDMRELPTLQTERLVLRPFNLSDAPEVQRLAGSRDIASTTLNIPHPYRDGIAEAWIKGHRGAFGRGESMALAVTLRVDGALVGTVSLALQEKHHRAELGYWIGVPYWGQGYCTEAAQAIVAYGFEVLGLHRICASHLARNLASGRVMQKLGMTREGCLRQHVKKWDAFEDLVCYGLLREEGEGRE